MFHAAVLFAQNDNLKFAEQTDAQRKKLLTKMLPELAIVDEWLEKAKVLRNSTQETLTRAETESSRRQHRFEALQDNDPTVLGEQWEADYSRRSSEAHARKTLLSERLGQAQAILQATPIPEVVQQLPPHIDDQSIVELGRASVATIDRLQLEIKNIEHAI
ncbi:MAG: hypothetical protein GY822_01670, partial [Deltaproteobacteria bacterium]|nr:hypothetical protein [Deltaproteobacteria bacterium]